MIIPGKYYKTQAGNKSKGEYEGDKIIKKVIL